MYKYFKEFREFAVKGNAVDLAVAVVIGAAFGKIISSLVADVIMPLASAAMGGFSLVDFKIIARVAKLASDGTVIRPAIVFKIGSFLQNIVDFLIISFAIFLVLKLVARLKRKLNLSAKTVEDDKPTQPLTKDQEILLEIRDILQTTKDERPQT